VYSRPDTTETAVRMGTIAVEGLNIFSREGGEAYLQDLPTAEM
jgi:hypothetical protein